VSGVATIVERVRQLVAPVLDDLGLELFDVEYGGGRLAVLADGPGGVDLDALTVATQQISALLDREDPLPGRYILEVSSPGLERRLRTPAHFRRYVGSLVSVKTNPSVEGERRARGTLTAADDEGFVVGERRFAYRDVEKVQTVFEWGAPARPPHPTRHKRSSAGGQRKGARSKAPTISDHEASGR
jgi:ribosome maturation factor RimP